MFLKLIQQNSMPQIVEIVCSQYILKHQNFYGKLLCQNPGKLKQNKASLYALLKSLTGKSEEMLKQIGMSNLYSLQIRSVTALLNQIHFQKKFRKKLGVILIV